MKCDLILKNFIGADGSQKVYVELVTPSGISCPIKQLAKNEKLYYKLKCEINGRASTEEEKKEKK